MTCEGFPRPRGDRPHIRITARSGRPGDRFGGGIRTLRWKKLCRSLGLWITRRWRCGLSLTLGGKCRIEGGADSCWIGAELPGDGTRHGRPAGRAALARSGRWARGAGEYKPVRLVGPLLGRPAVGDGAIRERASTHGEHAPGAQPSVKVWLHDPQYRQPRNECCGRPCSAHRPQQGGENHTRSHPEGRSGRLWAVPLGTGAGRRLVAVLVEERLH